MKIKRILQVGGICGREVFNLLCQGLSVSNIFDTDNEAALLEMAERLNIPLNELHAYAQMQCHLHDVLSVADSPEELSLLMEHIREQIQLYQESLEDAPRQGM